jgi:cytochrome c-type biogenesis protein CcmE
VKGRRAWVAIGICSVAVIAIVGLALQLSGNVVYYRTVSEAVKIRSAEARFRLAGAVVPGTITETATGVRFKVTDGKKTVTINHRGDPPQLFKPGAPVLCEGAWGASTAGGVAVFNSDRIMIKHGEQYSPPKVKITTTTSLPRG